MLRCLNGIPWNALRKGELRFSGGGLGSGRAPGQYVGDPGLDPRVTSTDQRINTDGQAKIEEMSP